MKKNENEKANNKVVIKYDSIYERGHSCVRLPKPYHNTVPTLSMDSQTTQSQSSDSQTNQSQSSDSQTNQSQSMDSQTTQSQSSGSQTTQSQSSDSQTTQSLSQQAAPIQQNPSFTIAATKPLYEPLAVTQTGNTVIVTVSIPAESFVTLPEQALEIKNVTSNLKITQCRFFNAIPPIALGKPADTAKLFLGGFIRKDIQYANVTRSTATTVEGEIKDFVVDVPISGVVDLGSNLTVPALQFDQQLEYEYFKTLPLPSGFAGKDRLLTGDLSEFNVLSNKFLNKLPTCELIYSQINDMNDAVDKVPLSGGPFEESVFRTILEKMVIVIQVSLTFEPADDPA